MTGSYQIKQNYITFLNKVLHVFTNDSMIIYVEYWNMGMTGHGCDTWDRVFANSVCSLTMLTVVTGIKNKLDNESKNSLWGCSHYLMYELYIVQTFLWLESSASYHASLWCCCFWFFLRNLLPAVYSRKKVHQTQDVFLQDGKFWVSGFQNTWFKLVQSKLNM